MTFKPSPHYARWLALAGFVLLIVGSKLWFIGGAGSDLPFNDQWDGESLRLLQPWLEGRLTAEDVFHPHNEHRIVTTKLYALGLFAANNSQWSVFVETTANALIHTLCALSLLLLARRWLRGGWLVTFGGLLVLLFTLPFSWENTLYGFQVQFYLLLLFSLGQIALTLRSDRFGWGWAGGLLCGLLAVITMASGFLASLAVLAVLGHRAVRERRLTAQQAVTAAVALASCVAGWLLKAEVPGHATLKAGGVGQFLVKLAEVLTWPTEVLPWALVLCVPALLFGFERLRRRTTTPDEAILLGLLVWVLLQFGAMAYSRGGGTVLTPRYFDLLSVNVALGFVFLARACAGRQRRLLGAAWLVAMTAGLLMESHKQWNDFVAPNIPRQWHQEANIRAYLLTHNPATVLNQPWDDIPYPDEHVLLDRLASPAIQAAMPAVVRRPVAVAAPDSTLPTEVPAGLSPPVNPLVLSTWRAPGGRYSWRSAVQPTSTLPVLRFRVAGDLGARGHPLHLVVKSAAGTVEVSPDFAPGEHWKIVTIFRPAGPWWIEAGDDDPAGWFAFTAPVELGRLSWLAQQLLKLHGVFLLTGLTLLAAAAALRRLAPDENIA
ncbi:MAG: hypothetical protein JSS11_02280 [Verrucomicrobia bacterium]|nr:hypothetical protein [Verrucomicrobiota bacterium]